MLFISDLHELEAMGARVFRGIIMSRSLPQFQKAWQKSVNDVFTYCSRVSAPWLRSLTDEQLDSEWHNFHNTLRPFWEAAVIPELGSYGGAPILRRALHRHGLRDESLQIASAILSAPERLSFYQEEERDFLKLYSIKSKTALTSALREHWRRYYWIENSYGAIRIMSLKDFQRRLRERKADWKDRRREIDRQILKIRKEKTRLNKKYKIPTRIRSIAHGLSLSIGWQDERKKQIFRYLHFQELFLHEYSRRSGVSMALLSTAMVSEVSVRPPLRQIQELRRRSRQAYVLDLSLRHYCVIGGRPARRLVATYWPVLRVKGKRSCSGIVAHPGPERIVGRVFIVRNHDQLRKFPAGAILVSTQTAPEYVTAIRKAKAIVTDAGGITSHAAIVAREYNKPCVVGTKYATSLLRTGDRVAVDARKGLVVKL